MSIPTLVPMQIGNGQLAVFIVHGAGGDVIHTAPLGVAMGRRFPMYGFQCPDRYDGAAPPASSIAELAGRYLSDLEQVSKADAAVIVGFSMGASVALEMAQLAAARSAAPLLLVNLDGCLRLGRQGSGGASDGEVAWRWTVHLVRDICESANPPELTELLAMDRAELALVALDYWKRTGDAPADAGPDYIERFIDTVYRNFSAHLAYYAREYPHRSLVLETEGAHEAHPNCALDQVLPNAIRSPVRTDHGNWFNPPTVDRIAAILSNELAKLTM